MRNSILIVGKGSDSAVKEQLFSITGTMDATAYFGVDSVVVEAVKALIQNNANNIKGILVGSYGVGENYETIDDAYAAALNKSLEDSTIRCVILDTTDTISLYGALKEHLNIAETNDIFRYGVVGAPAGTTDAQYITLAHDINHKRVFMVGPNVVDASNQEKDGVISAAGVAALMMSETNDPALPLNSIGIKGYAGVIRVLLRTDRNNLANAGVVALYPEDGQPIVWRLVSTYAAEDKVWMEGTTVFIADDVLDSVITRLKNNYKRTKNVSRVLESIRTDVIGVLEDKQGMEIIQNFNRDSVSVVRDQNDAYGALVDYEFQVVTPLYTITIRQHMKV